ncbi:MAG: putative flagella basal body P-ring formation protein FlgA [Pseudomonadota bacterium]|jgi:flagella basal body P-ring formation protein FlgA
MRRLIPLLPLLALLTCPAAALAEAEQVLAQALRDRYAGSLADGDLRLMLTTPVEGEVQGVQAITFDPGSGRFAAILLRPRDRVKVEGRAWTEMAVAVPVRRLAPGEIITPADLTTVAIRTDALSARALTGADALVGRQVRRVLAPGRPVPDGYVATPVVVARNKPVTVEFRSGALLLTARGRALEDGGVGDLIRIQNLDSNRTVTAVVTGPGVVSAAD